MRLCPWSLAWPRAFPILGLERVCPRKGCPWPRIIFVSLALASSLVSSTPPLLLIFAFCFFTLLFAFCVNCRFVFAFKQHRLPTLPPEVESSRTHFEVLGLEGQVLGLEASSPRKLACPRLEDSTIF